MEFQKSLRKLAYKLKLPEMRVVWGFWVFSATVLLLAGIDLNTSIKTFAILALSLGFGGYLSYRIFRFAMSNLGKKISSGRLESIVTNLEDAVVAYNNDFKILIFNSTAERIFGLSKGEIVGRIVGPEQASEEKLELLVQTLFPSLAPAVVGRSEPSKFPQVVDITFTAPSRELRASTDRITDKDGSLLGFVKVVRDRTREVQLVKSKSEFVSVAAHQLRTPLTAINWTFEMFSKNKQLGEEDRMLAKNGLIAATNLLKTVNDLLDTAEIEDGRFGYKYEATDIMKFIEGVLANAQIVAKKHGLKLYFDKGGFNELKLLIDPTKLGLALSNLVDNAMRYNSKNGSVTVRVRAVKDRPYIQISVQDVGVGIPPADVSKLFQKFFRAQNAKKVKVDGSGLGLYITKNIVEQHGGTIWVESTLGRGTTFYFTLPTDPNLVPKAEATIF